MALTKEKKHQVVAEMRQLLEDSKLTVVATYPGTNVKAMQNLRREARENGTIVKVVKNRLVKKALEQSEKLKDVSTDELKGQLLYALNDRDEVAPAQALSAFAKTNPSLEFVGAITPEGQFISRDDVKALADLPSKDQLRAQLAGTLAAPLSSFVSVLSGNIRGLINVLQARAEAMGG